MCSCLLLFFRFGLGFGDKGEAHGQFEVGDGDAFLISAVDKRNLRQIPDGAGIERVAPFFLSYSLAAIGVRIVLGGLSDRVGRRPVLFPAMAVLALAIASLGAVGSTPALVAVGLAFGAGQGMVYPTANALMVDLSHAGNLGRVQTLFSGSFSVGVAISAFVFGGIIERFGYPVAFVAAASCVGVGMGLLWLAPPLSSARRVASVPRESFEEDVPSCSEPSGCKSSH